MFLDIAFGLFVGKYFSFNYFYDSVLIIYLGIIFSLLPDIDFIGEFFYKKSRRENLKIFAHRGIFHTPFFYILISFVFYLLNFNFYFILLFLICTIYHLLHDLFVLGRGVMVLYPISTKRLKIFPDDGWNGYLKQKILWREEKNIYYNSKNISSLENFNIQNGHKESWVKIWYLRPNLFVFCELFLTIFFIFLYFSL